MGNEDHPPTASPWRCQAHPPSWRWSSPSHPAQQVLACGYHISRNTTAKLLAGAGYRRRSLRKALISGDVDPHERDRQFRLIATLRRQARARGVPVLCVDTRKKERLGHLPRRGS